MTTEAAARAKIETWFLAHEAELADPAHQGEGPSPQQLASLETALQEVGVDTKRLQDEGSVGGRLLSGRAGGPLDKPLGQVAGVCLGRKPTLRMLVAAERVVSSDAGRAAFTAAAASEVGSSGPKLTSLVTCLEELVHAFTWAPRRIVLAYGENMCALVDRYRLHPRLDDLWASQHSGIILVRHQAAFDALRLSDPASFLRLLDKFPHPEPSRHILGYAADRMNLNGLLALLALACPCFDAGKWLPRVKTPILIVAAIETKLETLADPGEDGTPTPSDAFAAAVEQTVQGVLARSDGNDLGYAWLQRLILLRRFAIKPGSSDHRSIPGSYSQLLGELASALPPRRDATDWIGAEDDLWRRDRAVAAIAGVGLGGTGNHDAAATLMGKALQMCPRTTGQEDGFSASSSPERWLVAAVIGRHAAPAAWFDDLWHDLVPIRDRARHMTTPAGGHAGDATVIAVSWFLFGLDAIDVRTPAHRALWRSLHVAVRDCAMAQTSPLAQAAWRMRYRFLAAVLAYRLVTLADEETVRDLQDFLGPILCLDMTLAEVVSVLFDARVAPAVIAVGAGHPTRLVELLRRLGAEQAWREARQKEQLGSQSRFSQAIARMADMIEDVALAS